MEDFIPQFVPCIRNKDIDAVKNQMCSGWIGSGKRVLEFEEKIKNINGAKHCISTTSGTTAIFIAIKALNLPLSSTILFPSYTFLAGANAAKLAGYNIELIDINPSTMCIDPILARQTRFYTNNISCMIFVNHNGYMGRDIQKLRVICDKFKIPMIEDSSQAIGIKNAGRTGDLGIFSFSVPKLITTGQGGAIVTDNDLLAQLCREIRDHGDNEWRTTRIHTKIGGNFKFNDISAAYGVSQLEDIDILLEQRRFIFDCYRKFLPIIDFGYESTWMVIYKTQFSNKIIEKLEQNNIQSVQYYRPIHHNLSYKTSLEYPIAENLARELVYLPSSLSLSEEQIERICGIIKKEEEKCKRKRL
jgi:perosamine synthetase